MVAKARIPAKGSFLVAKARIPAKGCLVWRQSLGGWPSILPRQGGLLGKTTTRRHPIPPPTG